MKINGKENISVDFVLIKIGFVPTENSLQFDFGNCKLKAIQSINRYFLEGYNFFGFYISERRAGELNFFLPLELESYEQVLAFMAYNLRNADLKIKPDWLNEGHALKEHLPWERELKEFQEKPSFSIEHEWFRVIVKKIRLLTQASTDEDVTTFSFDGAVLKVVCNNQPFVVSGLGKAWQQTVTVKTKSLSFLPKRIFKRDVWFYIWQDKFHIGKRAFDMVVLNTSQK